MMDRQEGAEHRYLFHEGRDCRAYDYFGAHAVSAAPEDGICFRVWAPRAQSVSVVGPFNGWDGAQAPMKRLPDDPSVWEILLTEARIGDLYKYEITGADGRVVRKADPFAFESEVSGEGIDSGKASRISRLAWGRVWGDRDWMRSRADRDLIHSPVNIYEVHIGSWKRRADGRLYSYREIADRLIPYVKGMGYTHIELLPLMEYPYDQSWGYQVTGYFSLTSRYGRPEDFMYFVERAHRAGIGVIMDWVPAHFPKDAFGLIEFDGAPLYESSDPYLMEHRGWGTRAFDFTRPEVVSFLVSSACFFCDTYHIDGLRVDAVAAMLYRNYDRQDGEWSPNRNGGMENLEVIDFLRVLNKTVRGRFPGVFTAAEESTAWPYVTRDPDQGGLGFTFKWNMGWMNDTLSYFETDPLFRRGVHNKLTFSLTYAYSENYILAVSHDEVVHGKKSLLDKMPGEYDDKFAGLRSFFLYQMTHPGKKLVFMGAEFGQFTEWTEAHELDWMLLDYDRHRQMQAYVKDLNGLYRDDRALWEMDDSYDGFRWVDADNADDNVYSYYRMDRGGEGDGTDLVVLNLSGKDYEGFAVNVPGGRDYILALDTDDPDYGGRGVRRGKTFEVLEREDGSTFILIDLPRLSGVLLRRAGSGPRKQKPKRKSASGKKPAGRKKSKTSARSAKKGKKPAGPAKKR